MENKINHPEESNNKQLERNKKLFHKYLTFFLIVFLVVSSFYIGYKKGQTSPDYQVKIPFVGSEVTNRYSSQTGSADFSLFWKVWDLMKEKFIDSKSLDAQQMVYGAIKGMVEASGDPYSAFLDPSETKDLTTQINGSFEGIGAELGIKDEILTVIAPLEGSPAQQAGLLAGDKIIKIQDKITSDLTIDEAVDLIRGPRGSQVTLTILRPGQNETEEIVVTRDVIELKSTDLKFLEDDTIAHLKINEFGEETAREMNEQIKSILEKGSKGLILDLRNNPGGLLDKSTEVASMMIPKGKVVVMEEDSQGQRKNLYTMGGDRLSTLPTVVLINEGSASAAEILAGALKENQGIKLIGKKTFGKGSVQEFLRLPQGSSVKITVAKWLTPNGNYIMEKGIEPDIEANITIDDIKNDRDPQLDKALEVLRSDLQ